MSYEKKIKDLMARVVSMSPEPPSFPEEITMATHEKPRSRPNPVLMFAAGAAVVAAVMVPVLLLSGDDVPIGAPTTTTTTVPGSSTIAGAPSTTLGPETTTTTTSPAPSTTVAAEVWGSIVYLTAEPTNSFLGNPALVPVQIEVIDSSGDLAAGDYITEALAAVRRQGGELPPGLGSSIPDAVQILDVTTESVAGEPTWVVDMNQAFVQGAGGLLSDVTMLNQIVYTVTQGTPEIEGVLFTVGGEPVVSYGTEGIDLTAPVTRESYIDDLNLIFLTEPISEFEHVYAVAGKANTFEAALTVRVLDGNGATVFEEPVMATCGSGCWGDFGVGIDSDLIVPGESSIMVFSYSAEDGSVSDAITVPLPASGVWHYDVGR